MSGKRVLIHTGQPEPMAAMQPVPMDGSGKPPNNGTIIDQLPRFPYCVLVIDGSPMVRSMVKTCLERAGMVVFCFPDGAQALQWLDEKVCIPHVLLIDIDTPQSWSPLSHYLQGSTVVVLTRSEDRLIQLHERLGGVRNWLIKPFSAADLLYAVQRCLRVSRSRRALDVR